MSNENKKEYLEEKKIEIMNALSNAYDEKMIYSALKEVDSKILRSIKEIILYILDDRLYEIQRENDKPHFAK